MNKLNNTINKLFNTRKKRNIFAVLLLSFIALVGVTIAYFGSDMSFKNLFKSKPFNTTVYEVFESPDSWTPGTTTPKEVYATNDSDVDVMVRVSYTEQWLDSNGNELPLEQEGNRAAIINLSNTQDWTQNRHYYNYNYTLKPGETTSSFMESVTFNQEITGSYECIIDENEHDVCTSTGTGYDGATYKLIITVEMMQADGEFYEDPRCQDNETCIAQINDTKYISLEGALDSAVDGDTIFMINNTTESVVNTKDVTLDLNGYTVTGAEDVTIQNNGKLKIIGGGSLENNTGTTINNEGTIQLGDNDGTVSQEIPEINGTTVGIKQKGIFNFYDGVITGKVAVAGLVTDKPESSLVYVDHIEENDYQKEYLIDTMSSRAVAMLNGTLYVNLQDAINTEESNQTNGVIQMIRNAELAYTLTVQNEDSTIVINLDGYNVETGYTITNNGNLKIIDEGETKGWLKPSVTLTNNKNLTIDGVTITATTDANVIDNNSVLNISNSTITANAGYAVNNTGTVLNLDENTSLLASKFSLYNSSTEELVLNKGSIQGIYNKGVSIVIEEGSNITNGTSHSIQNESGNLTIKNANIVANTTSTSSYAIYNKGTTTFESGTITADKQAIQNDGPFTFNSGTINAGTTGVNTLKKFTMNGGKIIANGSSYIVNVSNSNNSSAAIFEFNAGNIEGNLGVASSYGSLIMNGGTIKTTKYAIHNNSKTIINNGSVISETSEAIYNNSKLYLLGGSVTSKAKDGIYGYQGTIEIGEDDESVNTNTPVIQGTTYGINIRTSTVKFYDGVLKGITDSYYGTISLIPDGATIYDDTETIDETEYQTSYLKTLEKFVEVDGVGYNSLQKAIDSIETEGIIKVINNANLQATAEIPIDKKITIDLNSHEITTTLPITNNGTLTIDDTSEAKNGLLYNEIDNTILNNAGATINIKNGTLKSEKKSVIYNNGNTELNGGTLFAVNAYCIQNPTSSSTFTFNNGLIQSPNTYALYIQNGTAIMNSGKIDNTKYGVYTGNDGKFTMNNGEINATYTGLSVSGTTTIENGIIKSTDNDAIRNHSSKFTMNNGTVISTNGNGLFNNGTAKIINGYIASEKSNGIKSEGTTILGTDDDIVNIEKPVIQGEKYGLYRESGTIKFYDGILKGITDSYYGYITYVEETYSIKEDIETINEKEYITSYLYTGNNFVKVGDIEFNSLQKAIDSIETEGKIETISNGYIQETIIFPEEKNITFDLAGYEIPTAIEIINKGKLTITDSSENQTGKILNVGKINSVILNEGTLNIEKGSFIKDDQGHYTIQNKSIMNILGGYFESSSSEVIYNTTGTLTINGGSVVQAHTVSAAIRNYTGTITINNGNVISSSSGVTNTSGIFNINGGVFNATGNAVTNGKTMTITGGTFTSENKYAVHNSSTLQITGGIFVSKTTYGLYNSGTTTLGIYDQSIDVTKPVIQGATYGLYRYSGTIKFYDGILKGQTGGYSGAIATTEDDTIINSDTEIIDEVTYYTNYLIKQIDYVKNDTTGTIYNSLQDAIDEATSGDSLSLINDALNYVDITIPSDKEVTLDLKGYTISTTKKITNNGLFTIKDSTESPGTLKVTAPIVLIENNNDLILYNINILNEITSTTILQNKDYKTMKLEKVNINSISRIASYESSTLTLVDTNINVESSDGIEARGTLNVTGGTIQAKNNAIYITSTTTSAELSNVTIISAYNAIYNASKNETKINNCDITGKVTNATNGTLTSTENNIVGTVSNNSTGTLNLKDTHVLYEETGGYDSSTKTYALYNNTGTTIVESSNIEVNRINNDKYRRIYGVYNNGEGSIELNLTDVSIKDEAKTSNIYGLMNYSTGTITSNGGTITATGGKRAIGAYSYLADGMVTITTGNITVSDTIEGYGAYIEDGTLTLGVKEGNVVVDNPNVIAIGDTGIGIKKVNGYFMYYDGKITGSTNAKPETTTEVEYSYEATCHMDETTGYEYYVLEYLEG